MDFEWPTHISIPTNKCIGESSPVYIYVFCLSRHMAMSWRDGEGMENKQQGYY